jgi:hypothetical protein
VHKDTIRTFASKVQKVQKVQEVQKVDKVDKVYFRILTKKNDYDKEENG